MLEQRYHFPPKLLRIIKALHFGTRGKVCTHGHLSRPFQIRNGVRQGDVLAPSLFNIFLDAVMERALEGHVNDGVRIFYHPEAELVGSRRKMTHESFVQDLVYADDMYLVAATREALEGMLHSVNRVCKDVGLAINTTKIKIMSVLPSSPHQHHHPHPVVLSPHGAPVEVVEEFQCLGSIVTSTCTLDSEICSRISKASKSFTYLSRILWYKRKIKLTTKLRVLKAVVLPILLYGSETWSPTVFQLQRLLSFVMRCLRIILRVSVRDKLRNVEIRARAGVMTMESMIRRRLQWLGHLSRMDISRVPRQLMVCCPEGGKHMAGGQNRWNDVVSKDLKKGEVLSDWRQNTRDRREWKFCECIGRRYERELREVMEKQKKNELKKRREEAVLLGFQWLCDIRGCVFNAQSKSGLVNHQMQKHGPQASILLTCQFRGSQFHTQGLRNHEKACC